VSLCLCVSVSVVRTKKQAMAKRMKSVAVDSARPSLSVSMPYMSNSPIGAATPSDRSHPSHLPSMHSTQRHSPLIG
jgi:hypothetical protein